MRVITSDPVSQRRVAGVLADGGPGGPPDCRRHPGETALAPRPDAHQGDNHLERRAECIVELSGRLGARSQLFHYPAAKPLIYSAYRQRFDEMWNDTVNYGPLQQQPPYPATQVSPANNTVDVPTLAKLEWKRAPFATSFDVYLGTSTETMTRVRVNAQVDANPPETYTFTPAQPLQPSTNYYWHVVSRTIGTDANPSLSASSGIWVFRTAASGGGGTGSNPFSGTAMSLPGNVEAENFDSGGAGVAFLDTTPGNSGGQYRATDVDVAAAQDTGGGYVVGWVGSGEWLNYSVNVTMAGTYDMEFRIASGGAGGTFHIEVGGVNKSGPIAVPDTGGWQTWATVRKTGITLSAGPESSGWSWTPLARAAPSATSTGCASSPRAAPPPASSTPFTGTAVSLPGTVEAENFDNGGAGVAFVDTSPGNAGGQFRSTDVDLAAAADTGGGYVIGWVDAGEWLNYTVNVATPGTYDMEFRVASSGAGGTFHVDVDGVNKSGPISIPNTGGWQSWMTVRNTGIALSAGTQTSGSLWTPLGRAAPSPTSIGSASSPQAAHRLRLLPRRSVAPRCRCQGRSRRKTSTMAAQVWRSSICRPETPAANIARPMSTWRVLQTPAGFM